MSIVDMSDEAARASKKRRRTGVFTDFTYQHFNIFPNTGNRRIYGQFSNVSDNDVTYLSHMLTERSELTQPPDYSNCRIIVDESEQRQGFKSADPNYKLMLQIENFTAANSVFNISETLNNNRFWVWENWNGIIETLPSRIVWQNDMVEYSLESAFYSSQASICREMNSLTPEVVFSFNKNTLLITYQGTKPLILPFSTGFTPTYYKARPNISVTSSVNAIPPNVNLPVTVGTPTNFVFDATVNGQAINMTYYDPAFVTDYLAYKLGFMCGSNNDKIQMYFNYPIVSTCPNSPDPNVTTPQLQNGIGSIALILYPGAKSGPGDIYGALKTCFITSRDVVSPIPDTNILATIDVAGEVAFSEFQVGPFPPMPTMKQNASVEVVELQCVDAYQRPYPWVNGPPQVTLSFSVEQQM